MRTWKKVKAPVLGRRTESKREVEAILSHPLILPRLFPSKYDVSEEPRHKP